MKKWPISVIQRVEKDITLLAIKWKLNLMAIINYLITEILIRLLSICITGNCTLSISTNRYQVFAYCKLLFKEQWRIMIGTGKFPISALNEVFCRLSVNNLQQTLKRTNYLRFDKLIATDWEKSNTIADQVYSEAF